MCYFLKHHLVCPYLRLIHLPMKLVTTGNMPMALFYDYKKAVTLSVKSHHTLYCQNITYPSNVILYLYELKKEYAMYLYIMSACQHVGRGVYRSKRLVELFICTKILHLDLYSRV